ncbi:acidic endochitinase-like [Coffea eugenioides]|uniref:acidic endochitinase-like n=1 Tax=Coffea eugenioides TaxID=49369 RepID=UPI000F610972|nr:acidic endochitinase-like [Coffea eugenioides]
MTFQTENVDAKLIVDKAQQEWIEYEAENETDTRTNASSEVDRQIEQGWEPPKEGVIKINTDAAISAKMRVSADAECSSEGEGVGFYWGQSLHDENLAEMCNNSMYRYAVLASLNLEGNKPVLSIDDKCNPSYPAGCAYLGHMIDFCKAQGIKVLLSLGGRPDLSSDDAHNVAEYIWNNFLSNNSGPGPLNATVDGIDFRIQSGSNQSLDVLAQALRNYSTPERKVYLSAAPLCQIPDYYLDDAIKTGVFDHVWVQFFGDPSCKFYPPIWIAWYCYLDKYNTTLSLGITRNPDTDGFIPCDDLFTRTFFVVQFPKFGTLMVFEGRYECNFSSGVLLASGKKSMNKFYAID